MVSGNPISALPASARRGECVVIVGAGLAGLFTALKLAPHPVVLVSPRALGEDASSSWAQGGIAAAVSEGDTPEAHAHDTIRAGAGIVDERMAHLLAAEAAERIEDLLRLGVPFDTDLEGKLQLSREAAHGARRIARVKGDLAGKAIMAAVTDAARKTPSIHVLEGMSAHALAMSGGRVSGVHLWPAASPGQGEAFALPAKAVVLASGGTGQLYEVTTNPKSANGEGVAMAALAGAVIADAEFVQFHPTALNIGRDPAPLATEALRGEGAVLINGRGERYMTGAHEDAELAPRDVVARATFREVQAGRGAFIDCREAIGETFADAFPGLYDVCRSADIDPVSEPIPIAPAAHYHMGGVLTDANGRTSIEGLWACGEVASTGTHGANRLASNSLLETVVFGARTAADIAGLLYHLTPPRGSLSPPRDFDGPAQGAREAGRPGGSLRQIMSSCVGVVRTGTGLQDALRKLDGFVTPDAPHPLLNRVLTAQFIAAAALRREESRGAQFRSDFPEARDAWQKRSYLTLADVRTTVDAAAQRSPDNVIHAEFAR